jgi:alpha-L-fucosidase
MQLARPTTVSLVRLEENIADGQRVASYALHGSDGGGWRLLSRGTTIGCARLDRFEPVTVRRIRLEVAGATRTPEPVRLSLFGAPA